MSNGLDPYSNPGFGLLGDGDDILASETRTLIVLGAPRGGTSAIAGTLRHLGVFLGDNAAEPVFEDLELASAMEKKGLPEAIEKIADYNSRHTVWGYKRPGLAFSIGEVHPQLRNPIYLVVFRDLFATANRNMISSHLKNDITAKMTRIQQSYSEIVSFLQNERPYSLLFSYEKLISQPEAFVDFLIENTGLEVSEEQRNTAIEFVCPEPEAYLNHARADRCHGALDRLDGQTVRGWARYVSRFVPRPASVDIFLNGELAGSCVADQPTDESCSYPGVEEEACAFTFEIPKECIGTPLEIRARVSHERSDLEGSPLTVEGSSPKRFRFWPGRK